MSVLTLAKAKAHLNLTTATDDTELQAFIDAAEAAIANRVGPLAPVAVTRQVRGGGTALVLPVLPAISLTSVTPLGGTAVPLTDLSLDINTGMVVHAAYSAVFGSARYTVVYQAGRAQTPEDLLLAVKELVRHLWATQRGSGVVRPGSRPAAEVANTVPGAGYALPIRVEQLLVPHVRAGFY